MSIDATFANALAFAQDLIRLPSLSGEEGEVAGRLKAELEALAFEDVHVDEVGNVMGVIRGDGSAPPVLLNAHLDVVAPGDPSEWEYPPFSGEVAEGCLHGRGAMDIKGQVALLTHAAAVLRGRARGDVIVAHTVLEERGGWGIAHLLESGRFRPGAVLNGEATGGDVTIGHRGRGELEVVIHGLAGHASAPDRARNALDLLPDVLAGIRTLAGRRRSEPILGPESLVATGVDVVPESRNVIPDRAVVVVDWRVLPSDTEETLVARLSDAVKQRIPECPEGFRVEVGMARERQTAYTGVSETRRLFTPGFLMQPDAPVVQAAARAAGRRNGSGPAAVRPWTFATDGGWTCGVHGIPTVGFAPGEERFAHTNRERLDIEEARWAFDRYPEVILAMQDALA